MTFSTGARLDSPVGGADADFKVRAVKTERVVVGQVRFVRHDGRIIRRFWKGKVGISFRQKMCVHPPSSAVQQFSCGPRISWFPPSLRFAATRKFFAAFANFWA